MLVDGEQPTCARDTKNLSNAGATADSDLHNGDDLMSLGQQVCSQPWLYKCVLDGCNATFELLADLRTHFICSHQTKGSQLSVKCFCFVFTDLIYVYYNLSCISTDVSY